MKKLSLLAAMVTGLAVSVHAQGYFNFNNDGDLSGTVNSGLSFIGAAGVAGEGTVGSILGSGSVPNYSVGFMWAAGTFATDAAFQAATPITGVDTTVYIANTGDVVDGAGVFDGGSSSLLTTPVTTDGETITVEVLSWFNGNGTTTYANALSSSFNTGHSNPFTIRLAAGSDPTVADLSNMQGFAVQAAPEPTTIALAGLGGAALLAFRRRKA